jgi:prepilin-type processing-associated H-X9-DG protein
VELLVVISIIALLVSILLPALNKARESAVTTVCKSNIKQMGNVLYLYYSDYQKLPEGRPELDAGGYERHLYRIYSDGSFSGNVGLGMLYPKYLESPVLFWCPANRQKYEGYSVPEMVDNLKNGVAAEGSPSSYVYRKKAKASDTLSPYISLVPRSSSYVMMADAAYSDRTPSNHKDGYNAAFYDTHVEWAPDKGNKLFLQMSPYDFAKARKWSIDKFFYNADKMEYIK